MLLSLPLPPSPPSPPSPPFVADIHLPLSGAAAATALQANALLTHWLPNNQIDLLKKHTAHITLYLTEWRCSAPAVGVLGALCKEPLDKALTSTLYALASDICTVKVGRPFAAGNFAMLNVSLSPCLRHTADAVVNATHQLAVPNQTVPSWVYQLPEPERSEKVRDVQLYGSPNVYTQFEPHVTIGWDANATAVAAAVATLRARPASFRAGSVAIGTSGPHGTVLRRRDLAVFNLSFHGGDPCTQAHANIAGCQSDNITFGGCVWCDVVDHPPFCATRLNGRNLPRFPPHQCEFEV